MTNTAKPKPPTQAERLRALLDDGQWHDTDEIQRVVYGRSHLGTARIAARIYDIKRRLPQGWTIASGPVKGTALHVYRLVAPAKPLDLFDAKETA